MIDGKVIIRTFLLLSVSSPFITAQNSRDINVDDKLNADAVFENRNENLVAEPNEPAKMAAKTPKKPSQRQREKN